MMIKKWEVNEKRSKEKETYLNIKSNILKPFKNMKKKYKSEYIYKRK